MAYRISYERRRNRIPWGLMLISAAGLAALWREEWYEPLLRYVGAAIRGHGF